MEAKLAYAQPSTQLTAAPNTDLHKAWHLLSLLLRLGRPARPVELSSLCELFQTTPEFVQFLCSIPSSPLFLTKDSFVTFSLVGFVAFGQFTANSNLIPSFEPRLGFSEVRPGRICEDVTRTYYRKRKRVPSGLQCFPVAKRRGFPELVNVEEEGGAPLEWTKRIPHARGEVFPVDKFTRLSLIGMRGDKSPMSFHSDLQSIVRMGTSFLVGSNSRLSYNGLGSTENENETDKFVNGEELGYLHTRKCLPDLLNCENPPFMLHHTTVGRTVGPVPYPNSYFVNRMINMEVENISETQVAVNIESVRDERVKGEKAEQQVVGLESHQRDFQNFPVNTSKQVASTKKDTSQEITDGCNGMMPKVHTQKINSDVETQITIAADFPPMGLKQQTTSPTNREIFLRNSTKQQLQATRRPQERKRTVGALVEQQPCKRDKKSISKMQKLKQNYDEGTYVREKGEISKETKSQPEMKALPNFESFIVEEEEGSGGYGTVYRARRNNNGAIVAIKCPHENANRHHVQNELKMLERLGGMNNVIKLEGSFKSGKSECLVLEHVNHERLEVLKKEINVFQLQWYGYCMFRALAGLHKQGVIHRDVKPGNFLFSRKVNQGYLIDFNLALDLHQRYGTVEKLSAECDAPFNHISLSHAKSLPPIKSRTPSTSRNPVEINQVVGESLKPNSLSKNLKRKTEQTKSFTISRTRVIAKSQGADGSGITSAKNTPSTERLRQPMPCKGRQVLLSLAQQALQGRNHEITSVPASKRKRVAAPPGKVDKKHLYLTPMPLHSSGMAVAGAGSFTNKGDGKHKREGPCVGTKGFRAPEVLLKSQHQGPKVDIWSAGVTLLYLTIGRSPFPGEPEQNIKEIAKLRGSEDLWEVAKLHNRESSFPAELSDIQFLPSMKLRDWCKLNTRRPDFLERVPRALFDLVDKCLTVNPRLRISADEALRHEFFAPCHEELKKQKLLKRGISLDSENCNLSERVSCVLEPLS